MSNDRSIGSIWFRRLAISAATGAASALVGWFGVGFAWMLWSRLFFDQSKSTGLGEGVLFAVSIYLCAFVFGMSGFVLCLAWLTKVDSRRRRNSRGLTRTEARPRLASDN